MTKYREPPAFVCYTDKRGEHRWRFVVGTKKNAKITADSSEGYSTRSNCVRSAKRHIVNVAKAQIVAGYR